MKSLLSKLLLLSVVCTSVARAEQPVVPADMQAEKAESAKLGKFINSHAGATRMDCEHSSISSKIRLSAVRSGEDAVDFYYQSRSTPHEKVSVDQLSVGPTIYLHVKELELSVTFQNETPAFSNGQVDFLGRATQYPGWYNCEFK